MKLKRTPLFVTLLGILILGTATSGRFDNELILKYGLTLTGLIYTLHGLSKIYSDNKGIYN